MCLKVKNVRSKKATEDILCYKVVKKNYKGDLISPFYPKFVWQVGVEAGPNENAIRRFIPTDIEGGYLHSFSTISGALDMTLFGSDRKNLRIYKCVIPKGTHYYEGMHSNGFSGYASKKLKLIKLAKY